MKRPKGIDDNSSKPKKPRKAPNASNHQLAPSMPEGSVFTDLVKGQWKLGKPIGSGGFGSIYLTSQNVSFPVKEDAEFVMKLEPAENGPLFCELNFYQRSAKPDMIKEWMSKHSLKSLGVPRFIATGQHEYNGAKLRFMVMQRFGSDLQKKFEENGKQFPTHTVFLLGLKLMDILEYIHEKGYVHADIKAANLMTGYTDQNQVYLIDYGLAFRFMPDGKHKEYKEDPRKAHDGTVEFTSRDAHKGAFPSRRGDLEILGYCMLQWLCEKLPWENNLQNKDYVRDQKIRYMSDIPSLLNACLPGKSYPAEFSAYLTYVSKLKYDEQPSYNHCRRLFSQALKSCGHKETDKLEFSIKNRMSSKSGDVLKASSAKMKRKQGAMPSEENLPSSAASSRIRVIGSPSVNEEATQPERKIPRRNLSNCRDASLPRRPKPARPRKKPQLVGSSPQLSTSPLAIAARKSRSPSGRGGSCAAAPQTKKA